MQHRSQLLRAVMAAVLAIVAVSPLATEAQARQQPTPKVLGGLPQLASQAPWIVHIVTVDTKVPVTTNKRYYSTTCTGTVIAPTWILTAAHCVYDDDSAIISRYPATSIRAFAPGVQASVSKFFAKGRVVSKVYVHPMYGKTNGDTNGDVALLKLKDPIPGTTSMRMDSGAFNPMVGEELVSFGWGRTDRAGETSATSIQRAGLVIAGIPTDPQCAQWDIQGQSWSPAFLCATGPTEDTALCSGDSGGPWVSYDASGTPTLVGVTSYGPEETCGTLDYPVVATRLAPMRWWVDAVMSSGSSDLARTPVGPWIYSTNFLAFDNGAIENFATGHVMALGWPEPDDSIFLAERINIGSAKRIRAINPRENGRVGWQDTESTNWVSDAVALRDARVAWGISYYDYDADFPTLYVSSVVGTRAARDWAGTDLAQEVLGTDWDNYWHWAAPRLTPLASGGLAASWYLYNEVAGVEETVLAVFRADGSLNPSFSGDGWTRIELPGGGLGLDKVEEIGGQEYVLAGSIDGRCGAVKVNSSGSLSTAWGSGGVLTFSTPAFSGGGTCRISSIDADATDAIYAVGSEGELEGATTGAAFVTKITSAGAIDSTFAQRGYWIYDSPVNDEMLSVCRTTNGRIVAAGVGSASSLRGTASDLIGAMAIMTILTANGVPTTQMGGRDVKEYNLGGERNRFVAATCLSRGGAVLVGRTTVANSDPSSAKLHSLYIKINVR